MVLEFCFYPCLVLILLRSLCLIGTLRRPLRLHGVAHRLANVVLYEASCGLNAAASCTRTGEICLLIALPASMNDDLP